MPGGPAVPRSLATRVLSGIATVLAIAAVGYVVRGALPGHGTGRLELPAAAAAPGHGTGPFALSAAGRNVFPKGAATVATARHSSVRVYARPTASGSSKRRRKHSKRVRKHPRVLHQRIFNKQRIPLTFLVTDRRKGWLHVDLPTRPNRSRGWIRRSDANLTFTTMHIVVRRRAHRIRLYDGKRVVLTRKIAVGKALSPTPAGRYFITDKVRTTDPKGFYGPFALGLSAHSDVYTSFEGGDGQVGIHGTSDPSVLGSDVSHGCVRVSNTVIRELARVVPLGTPVTIRA